VEKSSQNIGCFCRFQKPAQFKRLPNRRKFAKFGHHVDNEIIIFCDLSCQPNPGNRGRSVFFQLACPNNYADISFVGR
jgi:hypothetical protein